MEQDIFSNIHLTFEETEYLLIQLLNRKIELKKHIFECENVSRTQSEELSKIDLLECKLINILKRGVNDEEKNKYTGLVEICKKL